MAAIIEERCLPTKQSQMSRRLKSRENRALSGLLKPLSPLSKQKQSRVFPLKFSPILLLKTWSSFLARSRCLQTHMVQAKIEFVAQKQTSNYL
ncbi:unnamed protein product [Amoebophrya sp. A25]|nr:unnamed protein product [Amoebophrya sp. A25]|eukprot:GSA25T00011693001.1